MMPKTDLASEATKAAFPAGVSVATLAGFSLNDIVMMATLAYIALQAGFLLWKWYRLATGKMARDE